MKMVVCGALVAVSACAAEPGPASPVGVRATSDPSASVSAAASREPPPDDAPCETQKLELQRTPPNRASGSHRGVLMYRPLGPTPDAESPQFVVGSTSVYLPVTPIIQSYTGHYVEIVGYERLIDPFSPIIGTALSGCSIALCGDDHL